MKLNLNEYVKKHMKGGTSIYKSVYQNPQIF